MRFVIALVGALGLAGCGSSSNGGGGGGGSGAGGGGGAGGTGGSTSTQCVSLGSELQDAVDATAKAPGGTAVAVLTEKCGLWEGAAGEARKGEAMSPEHRVRIGSVTKTYVSALTLKLVEQGKLGLDDTIGKWSNGVPGENTITVRMLLNMTSGLFNYTDEPSFLSAAFGKTTFTPEQLIAIGISQPISFNPGARFEYSNTNTIILGLICEEVGGAPLAKQLRDLVLTPSGLDKTYFDGSESVVGNLAQGLGTGGEDYTSAWHPSAAWAAGAYIATAGDTARWGHELYRGNVLGTAMMKELFTTVAADSFLPGAEYGLAAFAFPASAFGVNAIGHGGDIPGFHTWMLHVFDFNATIAVTVTSDLNKPDPILDALVGVLLKDATG